MGLEEGGASRALLGSIRFLHVRSCILCVCMDREGKQNDYSPAYLWSGQDGCRRC